MKKISFLALMAVVLISLSGCIVQSLNPFYTREAVCPEPVLAGEWRLLNEEGSPEAPTPWVFQKSKVMTYDKNGTSGELKVTYFRIGETLFMDTTAEGPGEATSRWWTMHVFPVHVVAKVELLKNRLTLTPLDYAWIEKALNEKTVTLPHLKTKDDNSIVFTASPLEWMEFLKKYSKDENVFSDKNAVRLMR